MKNQYYGFELKDMIRQFITAFNSIVINRYNKNKDVVDQIKCSFYSKAPSVSGGSIDSDHLKTPLPVNVGINMSIMTKFQTDMDQIISNFAPYNNPYIVMSWIIPTSQNLASNYEIRSEVLWSGDISLDYPIEVSGTQPARVIANTNFTIKGWLFKGPAASDTKNIFTIDQDFVPVSNFEYT